MRFRLIVASFVVFQAVLLQQFVAQRFPLSADDHSYLYQARLFAAGQFYSEHALYDHRHPLHPCVETNCLRDEGGRRFSKYPPGWPLVLSLGVLAHVPWLVQPLIAAALTLMLLSYVRRTAGASAEKTAGGLLVACVFWAYYGASYRPHMMTAFCIFAAFLAFERSRTRFAGATPWLLVSAALLGYSTLVRYTDWIPLFAWMAGVMWSARQWRRLVIASVTVAAIAAGNVLWSWVLAGRLFVLPTHLGGSIGDHDQLSLSWNGILFTLGRLAMLCWVFPPVLFLLRGWRDAWSPGRHLETGSVSLTLPVPRENRPPVGARTPGEVPIWVCIALFGANVAVYGFFGAAPGGPGPRYFLSYFPFLVAAVVSLRDAAVEHRTRGRALWRGLVVAQLVGSAIFITRETYTLAGRRDVERTFAAVGGLSDAGPRAVVLTTGTYHTDAADLTMNPPDLDGAPVLYVAHCTEDNIGALRRQTANRRWFTYRYPGELNELR